MPQAIQHQCDKYTQSIHQETCNIYNVYNVHQALKIVRLTGYVRFSLSQQQRTM